LEIGDKTITDPELTPVPQPQTVVGNTPPNSPFQTSANATNTPAGEPTPFKETALDQGKSGMPKLPHFSKKILLVIIFLIIVIVAGSVGGFLFFINRTVTNYTLIPEDTQFYLGLSVKNHPQVQQLLELSKKFPGGEKMVEYIDKNRVEILGTRKDPFKTILDLVESEIFLAKISDDELDPTPSPIPGGLGEIPPQPRRGTNALEQLVNIVEFKSNSEAKEKFGSIELDSNITTTKEAYGSAELAYFELKTQDENETTETFKTGALPYQVTLPLSKSIYASQLSNFIVAADKESDVKKVIDLITNSKDEKLKSIKDDEDHNEIVSHFPDQYLLKFYQKQVLDPFSNLIPTSALPTFFGIGDTTYDTRKRETEGDNVITVKRGLTIVAEDNGVGFSSYQLTNKSRIEQGLKHGFTISGSLASKLPSKFNGKEPLIYFEVKNIRGVIQDQLDQLDDTANKSSDKNQKELFERAKEGIEEMKKQFEEFFNLDVDDDLLSWMTGQSAFVFAPGRNGESPEALAVFEVDDTKLVEEKLAKFKMIDYIKQQQIQSLSSQLKNDIGSLATELQAYYTTPGQGVYPANLEEMVNIGGLKQLPTNPFGGEYGYVTCLDRTEAAVYGLAGDTGTYWVWSSEQNRAGDSGSDTPPVNCNVVVTYTYGNEKPFSRLDPEITQYKNSNIYFYPIINFGEEVYGFRFTFVGNLVIFSVGTSENVLRELIDQNGSTQNPLSADSKWQEQFANAPQIIGSNFYIVPKNIMGLFEYYVTKFPNYSEYIENDWVTVAQGYLKALKTVGTTTTQANQTFITNTFINVQELSADENKKVEEALQRILDGTDEYTQKRTKQAQDAQIKNDIGSLATELQAYYTTPGQGFYPDRLDDLLVDGGLRQMPQSPNGGSYEYITCKSNAESLVYGKLAGSENYWVWNSVSNRAIEANTQPDTNTCLSGAQSINDVQGVKDSPSALDVFWQNIKNSVSSP